MAILSLSNAIVVPSNPARYLLTAGSVETGDFREPGTDGKSGRGGGIFLRCSGAFLPVGGADGVAQADNKVRANRDSSKTILKGLVASSQCIEILSTLHLQSCCEILSRSCSLFFLGLLRDNGLVPQLSYLRSALVASPLVV